MKHLLVTNDFPPKTGGIQTYLWELWRRLPTDSFAVLTTPYAGAEEWDAAQPYRVERTRMPVLFPVPPLVAHINSLARETDADLVLLDPALPLGLVGPRLDRPYGLVLHGAEITVPGRLPGSTQLLGAVLRGAELIIAAGGYPAAEAEHAAGRTLPITVVPPGVDTERFQPLTVDERVRARQRWAVAPDAPLVVSASRLVPRKGMDVLIEASAMLRAEHPDLRVLIGGKGRDRGRLDRLVTRTGAPVDLVGFVADDELPGFYGCADVYAMLCRNRWGGLEQEGFGIVFVEAAATAVAQIAGASGGSAEAVEDGVTGLVVDRPDDVEDVAAALSRLLRDDAERGRMGIAARKRSVAEFGYDVLARRLGDALVAERPA